MEQVYKYFAFISYSSHDTVWGKRLQRKLENYRMPTTLCRDHGWQRKPMKPVFFAPTDIQPGELSEELKQRLTASRNLIVICSPASARSVWVGREIAFFHSLGRTKNIFFFIVDGKPHSRDKATECFNPVVEELGLPEQLGVNIHEKNYKWRVMNRERAYVQLITKLLGIEFDAIWQRHKRRMLEKAAAWLSGGIIVLMSLVGVWQMGLPFDAVISLNESTECNDKLPPLKDAVVTIALDNEVKADTIASVAERAVFVNVPSRLAGMKARVTFSCRDFMDVDTVMPISRDMALHIRRDTAVYGNVCFRLWNPRTEQTVSGCRVEIAGYKAVSDADGYVSLYIPLSEQCKSYCIRASVPLLDSVLYMPCVKSQIICVK